MDDVLGTAHSSVGESACQGCCQEETHKFRESTDLLKTAPWSSLKLKRIMALAVCESQNRNSRACVFELRESSCNSAATQPIPALHLGRLPRALNNFGQLSDGSAGWKGPCPPEAGAWGWGREGFRKQGGFRLEGLQRTLRTIFASYPGNHKHTNPQTFRFLPNKNANSREQSRKYRATDCGIPPGSRDKICKGQPGCVFSSSMIL